MKLTRDLGRSCLTVTRQTSDGRTDHRMGVVIRMADGGLVSR